MILESFLYFCRLFDGELIDLSVFEPPDNPTKKDLYECEKVN